MHPRRRNIRISPIPASRLARDPPIEIAGGEEPARAESKPLEPVSSDSNAPYPINEKRQPRSVPASRMHTNTEFRRLIASQNVADFVCMSEVARIVLQTRILRYRNVVVKLMAFISCAGFDAIVYRLSTQPAWGAFSLALFEKLLALLVESPSRNTFSDHNTPQSTINRCDAPRSRRRVQERLSAM